MPIVADTMITVQESDQDVTTGILLQNGDWLDIAATGTIWAGVWFTGRSGPQGWSNWTETNPDSPLVGVPPFCLLGKADAKYFLIGAGLRRTYLNETRGPGESELILRINDNTPGNGNGAFQVHIVVWR